MMTEMVSTTIVAGWQWAAPQHRLLLGPPSVAHNFNALPDRPHERWDQQARQAHCGSITHRSERELLSALKGGTELRDSSNPTYE
jgi:hypothetical protein